MRTASVPAGGLRWFIEEWGEPERPAVLLLHGFTGSAAIWHPVAERLRDLRLLVPDLPGHGRTEAPLPAEAWSLERLAGTLAALLDRFDLPRVALAGYSMGGRTALHLALRAPERVTRLVLIGASPGIASEAERRRRLEADLARAEQIEEEGVEAFVDRWEGMPIFATQRRLSQQARRRLRDVRLAHDACGLAASLRAFGTGAQRPLHESLPDLAMPVQLIVGAEDAKFRRIAESMREAIPDASVEVVPESGHAVAIENPAGLADLLASFLGDDREAGAPQGGEKRR